MSPLFSAQERERIAAAVRQVEAKSAVELVTVVAQRSDAYTLWRWLGATFATGLLTLTLRSAALHIDGLWSWLNDETLLLAQLPLTVTLVWLMGRPALLRALLPRRAIELAVHRAARVAFFEHNVYRTRDGTGVLIYLSRFERRVELLADRTIDARVGGDGWAHHVAAIVGAIRAGRPADGICRVVDELGATFAAELPRRDDDVNELPDVVVELP